MGSENKVSQKIRFLMSKPGIDGHWRGGVVVSRGLRDAGMEVIFGGFQNIDQIVESAINEDVDVIGMSIHSGAHFEYTRRLVDKLKERGVLDNFLIVLGGVIPAKDFSLLIEMGAAHVFGPGTVIRDIVKFIEENVKG